MEVHDAEVRWHEDIGNDPRLIVYVDDTPSLNELEFVGGKDLGLWYGEHDSGYANFFAWSGGRGDGYGGRHFEIETVDGREVTLKGPFSSRAGVMNRVGFGPVMDVAYKVPEFDHTYRSGALTVDRAEEVVDAYLDGVELVREEKFDADEPYWIPRRAGNSE